MTAVLARSVRACLIAVLAAGGLATAAMAASHPDLSGYWMLSRKPPPPDPELAAKIAPNTAVLNDVGPTELSAGDFGGLKPKPDAIAAARRWKPADDMSLSRVCAPPSIIYAMQGPFPLQIYQGTELIIIRLEYFDMVRIVFMDGRKHLPDDAPHSKVGDSIGHWEGSTLVVDTTHLESATLTNNGLNHSDDVHVIERFKLGSGGKTLLSSQEFEDPAVLDNRGARFVAWNREEGQYIYPYECDPSFGLNYGARETGAKGAASAP